MRALRRVVGALVMVATMVLAVTGTGPMAGAQGAPGDPSPTTSVPPLRPPTTLAPDDPVIQGSDCGPGNIVRPPYCGQEPESRDDPGGWLQVSLFFLVCAVILGMVAFVWWRSRVARRDRQDAGLDPVTVARRSGQGLRPGEAPEP